MPYNFYTFEVFILQACNKKIIISQEETKTDKKCRMIYIINIHYNLQHNCSVTRGEKGQPQPFLIRATFSSFSRPSHLEISYPFKSIFFMCRILEDENIF